MKKIIQHFLLSILFGIFITISVEPFHVPLIRWIVPWFFFYYGEELKHQSILKILGISFLLALSLCVFAFYWVIHLFVVYGGIPLYISIFLFIPYSFLLNSKIPLILLFLAKLKQKYSILNYFLSIPVVITLLDMFTPQVFNWYWGNLVTQNLIFSQIADIVGIHGITFLYILFSYVFYRLFRVLFISKKNPFRKKKLQYFYISLILIFIGIHVYGIYQLKSYEHISKNTKKIRVASIQPNAPLEKYGEQKVTDEVLESLMLDTIPALMDKAFRKGEQKIDLFILPESGVPYYTTQKDRFTLKFNAYHPYFEFLIHRANAKYNADVFFNEFAYQLKKEKFRTRVVVLNSSALISRRGFKEAIYHKRKLIAFGEQIPMADFLESTGLIQLVPESIRYSRFESGKDFTPIPYMIMNTNQPFSKQIYPFQPVEELTRSDAIQKFFKKRVFTPSGYFMPLICYEIIQPDYVRDFFNNSKKSIDFIVNLTQDRWYGKTIESYQHMELGRIRAIELRRAIIRSTNSGVSTAFDITGKYLEPVYGDYQTQQEVEDIQIFDVPIIKNKQTLYSQYGNSWFFLFIFIYIIRLFLLYKQRPLTKK